jgi:hypothetical protein
MDIIDSKSTIDRYKEIVEFCERAISMPFYSEQLLPLSKQSLLNAIQTIEPATEQTQLLIKSIDKFIPHDIAISLLIDFDHIERKRNNQEYNPEAVKRYWKRVHALFGVDEQLGA